jgi:predicted alpha/beta hydrolase family esterase
MRNAIILHGKPNKADYYDPDQPVCSNWFWIAWLQKQLIIRDIKADTPEVPFSFEPRYQLWKKEVEKFEITQETCLVGHSCGGGFWLRWLSEDSSIRVGKIILVAPSHGYGDSWKGSDFFHYRADSSLIDRTAGIIVFVSDNDKPAILRGVESYKQEFRGLKIRTFPGYGHFTQHDMSGPEFTELLDEVLPG